MARQFSRGPRRKTQWAGFGNAGGAAAIPTPVMVTAGTSTILSQGAVIGGAFGLVDEEATITRTIGMITAQMDVDTAEAVAGVSVGCGIFLTTSLVAGVVSLASVEDDPDFEWLYFASFGLINPMNALRDGPVSGIHIPFDVRGQRIVRTGYTAVWLAESQSSNVTVGVNGRYLNKLT